MKRFHLPILLSTLVLVAPGVGVAADAKELYSTTCIACHGANGKGAFPGVPDLHSRMTMTDADLTNSILNGMQSKGAPIAMPPKGGNPAITAADAAALVFYLRTQLLKDAESAPSPSPAKSPAGAAKKASAVNPRAMAAGVQRPLAANPLVAKSNPKAAAVQPPLASAPSTAAHESTPDTSPTNAAAQSPATGPPSDMAAFARGAKAWGEHCASCHAMRNPKSFSDARWKVVTTHMRVRAGLDGADVRDIYIFLSGSN